MVHQFQPLYANDLTQIWQPKKLINSVLTSTHVEPMDDYLLQQSRSPGHARPLAMADCLRSTLISSYHATRRVCSKG